VFHLKDVYNNNYRECDRKVKDKQLKVLTDDKIINPYFTQNHVVKYLYCTDQLELFRRHITTLCMILRRWKKLSVRMMRRIHILI
jgi:hypothetical protein